MPLSNVRHDFTLERIHALEGSSKCLYGYFAELSSESSVMLSQTQNKLNCMKIDPLVIAIYRKRNPNRLGGDVPVWTREQGLLVPVESLVHGLILWALSEGREDKPRLQMRYCEPLEQIVFPDKFVQKKSSYRPWSAVKASIKSFYKGRKPSDVSWKQAKREVEAGFRRKSNTACEEPSWPRLMQQRAGTGPSIADAPSFLHA